jgi:signal transduction histidine kinase
MRFSIKMTLGFIILLSLTFGVGGSLLIMASFNDALSRAEQSALASHRLLLYTLAAVNGGAASKDDSTASTLEQLDAQGGRSWMSLRLSDGSRTLFQSKNASVFNRAMLDNVSPSRLVSMIRTTDSGAHLLLIAGQYQTADGTRFLESAYDLSPVYTARQTQEIIYRKVFAAVVVLGAGVSWLMSFLLTRPLRKLSEVTRKIASGDLSSRVSVGGRDEIGTLALDFNEMTDRLEETITELRDAMHRQEEFMGGFAHELKTPMTSIIGYADLLRSHELSDSERREAANYVFTEGRRLEILSLKLLDLLVMKRRDFAFIPSNIKHIVSEVVRLLKPVTVKLGITVKCRCEEGLCMLEPDLVKSLLINLADNARKAFDSGGEIFIEAKLLPDGCVIRVADNGKGIPETELSKITEAFYRVDKSRSRAQGGVGLGLALCREIADLHNGTISFDSAVGRGTVVTVTLKGGAVPCEES